MKIVMAGSRHLNSNFVVNVLRGNTKLIRDWAYKTFNTNIIEVVWLIGMCPNGADKIPIICGLSYEPYKAEQEKFGKAAWSISNEQMANDGEGLLLVWDGKSRGSQNMKKRMIAKGKPVLEILLTQGIHDEICIQLQEL